MNEFQTGAVRDVGGKGRMDLLPMCALIRVSKHMEDAIAPDPKTGMPHYPERNWEKGLPMHSMIDSAFRHLAKYVDGWTDEDHLCAAATNLLMAMWMEEKKPDMQDIPTRPREGHSPCSEDRGGTPIPPECSTQGEAPSVVKKCGFYEASSRQCRSVWDKRLDCTCDGNTKACDFFEFMRNNP